MERGPRLKTSEELAEQAKSVSDSLGQEISQPSKKNEVFNLSLEEIKARFPRRYDIYLKNLKAKKAGKEIDPDEKEKMVKWLIVLNNLDKYIEAHKSGGDVTLREHQIGPFEALRDFLEEGGDAGHIKLPTGSGKTVVGAEFIEATGLKTLVVVPTRTLVGQTMGQLQKHIKGRKVGAYFSEQKGLTMDVDVTTYQSLKNIDTKKYDLVIFDEAHKAEGEDTAKLVSETKCMVKLGLTATPTKRTSELMGEEIYSMQLRDMIEIGALAPCQVNLAKVKNIDTSNVTVNRNGEYSESELEAILNVRPANEAAVKLYKEGFAGEKMIAFTAGKLHAKDLSELFNARGIRAGFIIGETSTADREDLFARFKGKRVLRNKEGAVIGEEMIPTEDQIDVLIGARVLIEGFDEPRASVCFNIVPTASKVVAEQRGGRVLRRDDDNPGKEATVVDFVYEGKNNRQILFSRVLGGARVGSVGKSVFGESIGDKDYSRDRDQFRTRGFIEIEGIEFIVNEEEVMKVERKMDDEAYDFAPEDWKTNGGLAEDIGTSFSVVKRIAESVRGEKPEWFRIYKFKGGRVEEYYSPELVKLIMEEVQAREEAPVGWKTNGFVANVLDYAHSTISKIADKYRVSNPEWFRKYKIKAGRVEEHYAPDLVTEIRQELASREFAPEGWVTNKSLSNELDVDKGTVRNSANRYRADHPDMFRVFKNKLGQITEHYSPELALMVKRDISTRENRPEGWMTNGELFNELDVDETTVKNRADRYRASHPDWFRVYKNKTNKPTEHYSPELAAIIKRDIVSYEYAPEGWHITNELAEGLGVSARSIQNEAERHRFAHPDWFKKYKVRMGRVLEHYSPELISIIKAKFMGQEFAPAGWRPNAPLALELGSTPYTVKKIAERYRAANPAWFRQYKPKTGPITEYYHPDLVEKIKEALGK